VFNRINNKLIEYVTKQLFDSNESCSLLSESEWKPFFDEAVAQQVECVIYETVLDKSCENGEILYFLDEWKKFIMMRTLIHKKKCRNVSDFFIAMNESEIPYVTFKGYVFKELYPEPMMRYMGDIDIYVEKKNVEKASEVLNSLGYIEKVDPNHPFHITFKKDGAINIELHYNFFHDDVFHNELYLEKHIWDDTQVITINDVEVCVPSLEHSLVQGILHIITHFVGKGFGLRQLVDIGLFLDKYESEISFDLVKLILEDYRSIKTYAYIIEMCNRYFNRNYTIFKVDIEEHAIDALDDLLFDSGVFGLKSYGNELKRIITRQKLKNNIKSKSSFRLKWIVLFPSSMRIGDKYKYAKRIKLLLPIAWIHRILLSLVYPNRASRELLMKKIDVHSVEQKIELMDFFNLNINQ